MFLQQYCQAAGFWVLSVDLAANDAADANVLVSLNHLKSWKEKSIQNSKHNLQNKLVSSDALVMYSWHLLTLSTLLTRLTLLTMLMLMLKFLTTLTLTTIYRHCWQCWHCWFVNVNVDIVDNVNIIDIVDNGNGNVDCVDVDHTIDIVVAIWNNNLNGFWGYSINLKNFN